jgi:hypothetical protein
MTLEAIRSFMVPRSIVTETELSLQAAGNEGYELFVLWSGVADADTFSDPHRARSETNVVSD